MQEIVISKKDNSKTIALVENGILQEVYYEDEEKERLEGNLYYGIVKDVLPGMQAVFVDIGKEKNTFLHIKDLIPKVSQITGNKEEDLQKYNIKDYVKNGDKILVQVKKDAGGMKGAKVSTDIQIQGRFVILLPKDKFTTISKKIENEDEKKRLVEITNNYLKENKEEVGIIIRTAANKRNKEEIEEDLKNVIQQWKTIDKNIKDKKIKAPAVIQKNSTILEKILIDTVDNGISKIYTDDPKVLEETESILEKINSNYETIIQLIEDNNLLNKYEIEKQIEKIKLNKIWLKCGGFITIDKTEALTAIDVNSGKFTGKKNLEETVLKVNQEASIEIARQLRLRDIGGIIIIDYINMKEEASRAKVLETLNYALKKDRSKTQIIEFTKLNLLEMTRKHMFSK